MIGTREGVHCLAPGTSVSNGTVLIPHIRCSELADCADATSHL
jgi:hypothetical protein